MGAPSGVAVLPGGRSRALGFARDSGDALPGSASRGIRTGVRGLQPQRAERGGAHGAARALRARWAGLALSGWFRPRSRARRRRSEAPGELDGALSVRKLDARRALRRAHARGRGGLGLAARRDERARATRPLRDEGGLVALLHRARAAARAFCVHPAHPVHAAARAAAERRVQARRHDRRAEGPEPEHEREGEPQQEVEHRWRQLRSPGRPRQGGASSPTEGCYPRAVAKARELELEATFDEPRASSVRAGEPRGAAYEVRR